MDVESIRLDPELAYQMMALLGRELKSTKKDIGQLRAEAAELQAAGKEVVPSLNLNKEIEELKAKLKVAGGKTEIILLQAERQKLVERAENSEDYARRVSETAESLGAQSRRLRESLGAAHVVCAPECGSTLEAPLVVDPIEDLMERQELISGLKEYKKALLKVEQERDKEFAEKKRLKSMCSDFKSQVEELSGQLNLREQMCSSFKSQVEELTGELNRHKQVLSSKATKSKASVNDAVKIPAQCVSPLAKAQGAANQVPKLPQNLPGPTVQVSAPTTKASFLFFPPLCVRGLFQYLALQTKAKVIEAPKKRKADTTANITQNVDFNAYLAAFKSPAGLPSWGSLLPIPNVSSPKQLEKLFHSVSGSHNPTYLYLPGRSIWDDAQNAALAFGPCLKLCGKAEWSLETSFACLAEKHIEYFFEDEGKIFYAGTYRCHETRRWFPLGIQLGKNISALEMARATASKTQAGTQGKKIQTQYQTGKLKIECLVLECIGFDYSLYEKLRTGYSKKRKAGEDGGSARRSKRNKL
ncbi:hypothetical protein DXG03_002727 [Asterophora parasitica]|uniref:DUF6697 domain-containing protein n=1 Tax=Asterophora parasitica TaxID=117018 RepID=A0A9P7G8J7_9AGAR|nr:hypothetical protein DXG03_002727 [Asterophora parasitica]